MIWLSTECCQIWLKVRITNVQYGLKPEPEQTPIEINDVCAIR
jgi:hypothetical protein